LCFQGVVLGLFEYISVLTSIIIGLGMAHLLRGLAGLMQHPGRHKIYWVHLLWVGFMFFNMIFFWWWEFSLATLDVWLFQNYLFIVAYAVVLYLMCALLFPTDLDDYTGFKDYFLSRRAWFFGLLGLITAIDIYDTWLKGAEHFASLGVEYKVFTAFNFLAAIVGAVSREHRVQAVIAVILFVYQIQWAFSHWGQQA
jgi:hypothetical protein